MRITKIPKIKNYRIFRDFSWREDLPGFSRYNAIYGWNGSGKTTLSTIFSYLDRQRDSTEICDAEIVFEIDGNRRVKFGVDENVPLPQIRVFNKAFIDATVLENKVNSIYYFGEDSIELQERVEHLKQQRSEIQNQSEVANNELVALQSQLETFKRTKAKDVKEKVRANQFYHNYNARNFKEAIEKLSASSAQEALVDESVLTELENKKTAETKPIIQKIVVAEINFEKHSNEVNGLISRQVITNIIDALKEDSHLGSWVENGLRLHQSRKECEFCGGDLSQERKTRLAEHFNDQLRNFGNDISSKIRDLDGLKVNPSIPDLARFYQEFQSSIQTETSKLENEIQKLEKWKTTTIKALKEKQISVFNKFENIDSFSSKALCVSAKTINALIVQQNERTKNFDQSVKEACKKLEHHFVAEAFGEYDAMVVKIKTIEDGQPDRQHRTDEIEREISETEERIREDLRPASELNRELCDYLGRNELKFETVENGYQLMRNDRLGKNLSEGEKTAIAFLYFLKSLKDQSFTLENGIVVIDDPISSLDGNSLFQAFAFMKERTKNSGQLFLMTHNFSFFNQIKNWFHKIPKIGSPKIRPVRFFSIQTNGAPRNSSLNPLDPFLEIYNSEYHYLFKLVVSASKETCGSLEDYYPMPNIARRLLETFLAFRFPKKQGLYSKLECVTFDDAKKTRVLRLLHTHSHGDVISDSLENLDFLRETPQVLKDILELMKVEDEKHFDGMMSLISSQSD